MQKQRVVAWLAQHNFPHGIVSFCDGLVHDPLRHKANFLKSLITDVSLGLLKYDRSRGLDCSLSNCACQHQSLGSNVTHSGRLICLFSSFYCSTKVSTLLNCVIFALLHFITGPSNIKCLMKQRLPCLSSSHVRFFHLSGGFLAARGVTSRSERTRSCCRNGLAPPNLGGRCHRASSQASHLREVLMSLIPEPQKSSR